MREPRATRRSQSHRSTGRWIRRAVWGVGLMVWMAPMALGQPESGPSLGEVIDVELVNVEVWVHDRRGQPIEGLLAQDFEVLEDGEPMAISHFREVRNGRSTDREPLEAPPAAAPDPRLDLAPINDDRGHLIVYFDELHLGATSRKQILGDLRFFLREQRFPPDRVMLVRQTNDLLTEAPFGSTPEQLTGALERLEGSVQGVTATQDLQLSIRRLEDLWEESRQLVNQGPNSNTGAACGIFLQRAKPEIDIYSRQERDRLLKTLRNLGTTSGLLAGVPGVKTLLYVSDRLELRPGEGLLAYVDAVCPQAGREENLRGNLEELSSRFRRLTRDANANRVTIHSLQAFGARRANTGGAEQRSILREAGRVDFARRTAERDGLSVLAVETGGRMIVDRSDFDEALDTLVRDMGTYYSLAYPPIHGGDRQGHRIEVRLRKGIHPGARIRHRNGYRDKGPDERLNEKLQSALYLGEVSNPLAARLASGEMVATEDGRGEETTWSLPLHVLIPVDSLAFLDHAGDAYAQVELRVARRDMVTLEVTTDSQSFRTRRPPPESGSELLDFVHHVEIGVGTHVLALAIRDQVTRETSFLTTALEIHPPGGLPEGR